jgi:ribosomal protein L11 methyltransferase
VQIHLEAASGTAGDVAEALMRSGALSVTLADAADDPVLEPKPGETPLWPNITVTGLFDSSHDPDLVLLQLRGELAAGIPLRARVTTLDGEDWANRWKQDFHAMRFGERLWICPHGETAPEAGAITVNLDPGMAFGTGTHPTTALCLEWLDLNCRAGDRLIDYGCGSGILAIAAARLGAAQVWAVDIDRQALQATVANAAANGVGETIWTGAPQALPAVEADCLVANILAGPLVELAPRFAALLPAGGRLAVSGILHQQADAVAVALAADFVVTGHIRREDWSLLHARRR